MKSRNQHTLISISMVIYCVFNSFIAVGQNGFANHWHINHNMHVDFSLGGPFVDTLSELNTFESSISYSNTDGELLFYSNGGAIPTYEASGGYLWNRNHEVMPNGILVDTMGCQSSSNGGIVIPDFTDDNIFWVFTSDCSETHTLAPEQHIGLRSTKIDMSLDGGLGDVLEKGVPIYGDSSHKFDEGIGATRHANGVDYWIIMHGYNYPLSDTFYVFLFNESGVSPPIVQTIGSTIEGKIEISPNGKHMTYGNEFYTFDKASGVISSPINLDINLVSSSFSPDSRFLYTVDAHNLYQYDCSSPDLLASRILVYHASDEPVYEFGGMQLGPNCKIYVARLEHSSFGVINLANEPGLACNYVHNQLMHGLPYWLNAIWFPNYIDSEFACETVTIEEIDKDYFLLTQATDGQSIRLSFNPKRASDTIMIFDATGRLIGQYIATNNNTEIDISNFSDGVYVVNIPGINQSQKFLKF
ncbi:MAG: hypothetical protein ACI8ZM_004522 [Crocinitomix sp.]|jgi:hypothetical protein